ncbi:MAG: hypothetical protein QOH72_5103 [Solirubrobacteraceae bacterium]|jgi:hypothetical protein|nr:hypothetical protein [Solirubrobacteraceae bacterium]
MLVLLYPELLKASEPAMPKHGRPRRPKRKHPPPGRLRARVARTLAVIASRLDRESARRALV